MTEHEKIPWKRLVAEAVAIVGSILLAFAIDAKWQEIQSRIEEKSILSSIEREIGANLNELDRQRSYRENMVVVINSLFSASDGSTALDSDELDAHILEVTAWARSAFKMGAINSLSQGRSFLNVKDVELRAKLVDLQTLYRWVDEMERREEEYSTNYLNPFLAKNAFLPQIASSTTSRFPGVITEVTEGYATGEGRNHAYLLANEEFLGMLVQEKWNHEDALQNYDRINSLMLQVRSMISQDLRE